METPLDNMSRLVYAEGMSNPTNTEIVRARMVIESARKITDRYEIPSGRLVLEAAEVLAAALDNLTKPATEVDFRQVNLEDSKLIGTAHIDEHTDEVIAFKAAFHSPGMSEQAILVDSDDCPPHGIERQWVKP